MKLITVYLLLVLAMNETIIFNFSKESNITNWTLVNDGVMGGKSNSTFTISDEGHGVFSGIISLENNGGFASVHYSFNTLEISPSSSVKLYIKGDTKKYQLRIKDDARKFYSYTTTFETTGEWQEITIKLKDLIPKFRGKQLDKPNFNHDKIERLSFLIANKKSENFILKIDKIVLVN